MKETKLPRLHFQTRYFEEGKGEHYALAGDYYDALAKFAQDQNYDRLKPFLHDIHSVTIHEEYEFGREKLPHDIAVVRFREDLVLGPTLQPICLPSGHLDQTSSESEYTYSGFIWAGTKS